MGRNDRYIYKVLLRSTHGIDINNNKLIIVHMICDDEGKQKYENSNQYHSVHPC